MKLLITGGAGFIGSNFIRYLLENRRDVQLTSLDRLSYAGNLENLADISGNQRYRFVRGDIASISDVEEGLKSGVDAVINFAAESHVDRSILDSSSFLRTNVLGTQILLEASRQSKVSRFIQISTDEVYGSLSSEGKFTEKSPLAANSPYAATKAAADLLCRAYHKTFGMDVIITRCSNNYGPYQFPEKLIPLMILNALKDKPLPVYGDGMHTRDWIHVKDHCSALDRVLMDGRAGQVYNVGSNQERKNLQVVHQILKALGKPPDLVQFVRDRPGHDRRYAIDSSLLQKKLGWVPNINFEEGLTDTVRWYRENSTWLKNVQSGAYRQYYQLLYEERAQTLKDL